MLQENIVPEIKNKNHAEIFHIFTHFELRAKIIHIHFQDIAKKQDISEFLTQHSDGKWMAIKNIDPQTLPSLMRKIFAHIHQRPENPKSNFTIHDKK